MPRTPTARDYELATQLGKLPGYSLVGTREVAAMTGFALNSVRQRKVPLPPAVYSTRRKILWRLQDVREWLTKLSVTRRARRAMTQLPLGEASRNLETASVSRDTR
jgi:hypothetical protein